MVGRKPHDPSMILRRKYVWVVGAVSLLVSACAGLPAGGDQVAQCTFLLEQVDQRVRDLEVGDAEASPIRGFAYLRINRFLASFKDEVEEQPAFDEWVRRLRALDREGRQVELQNLGAANISFTVDECAERLLSADLKDAGFKARLLSAAHSPSHYDDWVRALGLYPLTQVGVALGFDRWKADNLPTFAENPSKWVDGETRYALPGKASLATDEIAALIDLSSQNALGVPDIEGSVLSRMAAQYAPVFAVAETSGADRIGRPFWTDDSPAPHTDTADPTIYVRLAHTRMGGEVLPQLVYTVWFPARPKEGPFDILGGKLDGLVWRVTLDRQGHPLVYDSFHSCGCYHLFFPTDRVERVAVAEDNDLREEPLTPRQAPTLERDQRMALHVASRSHYLRGLSGAENWDGAEVLHLVDEAAAPTFGLRSIKAQGEARRSLFRPDGMVAGTERAERLILWPMGISSPGAMRQWGTHATAFVGERHADDPYLLDEAFKR